MVESICEARSISVIARFRSPLRKTPYAAHPDTLLALQLNGARLTLDHGFPARLIAPNRAGVLQTKWVERLEVIA